MAYGNLILRGCLLAIFGLSLIEATGVNVRQKRQQQYPAEISMMSNISKIWIYKMLN
jgi:hypothetical protein